MTKPREKTCEELQAEIEDGKKKIRQFESRENRLSFFYADRQKGATSYDETERENPRGIDRRD